MKRIQNTQETIIFQKCDFTNKLNSFVGCIVELYTTDLVLTSQSILTKSPDAIKCSRVVYGNIEEFYITNEGLLMGIVSIMLDQIGTENRLVFNLNINEF